MSGSASASAAEPYWFNKPSVLFSAPAAQSQMLENGTRDCAPPTFGQQLQNAFVPDLSLGLSNASNINRITRIVFVVAILLALILRSWWPVAIGAGGAAIALLVAYGMQVHYDRERRKNAQKEPLMESGTSDALSMQSSFESNDQTASVFVEPEFPDAQFDLQQWGTNSYVPNEHNNRTNLVVWNSDDDNDDCGPGGPMPSSDIFNDPRAAIPNPSAHNRYEQVDARYRMNESEPIPVQVQGLGSTGNGKLRKEKRNKSASFGIDARSANPTQLTSSYQKPQSLSMTYMQNIGRSNARSNAQSNAQSNTNDLEEPVESVRMAEIMENDCTFPSPQYVQPATHTDKMLQQMYTDTNATFWNEMIAKRAPDWRANPNDPRNRLALQNKEIERQAFRGLQWSQGA